MLKSALYGSLGTKPTNQEWNGRRPLLSRVPNSRDYMKVRAKELGLKHVRVNLAGCLDRCELGPCVVIYPEGVWYKIGSPADVDAVLEQHVRDGGRVSALLLPPG